jgi:O-antigen/teichoic acid export membrane protein
LEAERKPWTAILLSVFERIASRGSAALITLLLAITTDPQAVGQYATMILSITIYQALTDGVIRQIGVEAWNFRNGKSFLRRCSLISGILGSIFVAGFLLIVCLPSFSWSLVLRLLPLVFVPLVSSLYLELLTRAQRSDQGWQLIAKSQLWAAVISVVVAVPLLPSLGIGAAALQVLIAEIVFLVMIQLRPTPVPRTEGRLSLWRRYFLPTAISSVLGWSQSQLERLVLVVLSTPATLGTYSLSVAIARTASDAITSGLVNATRSHISTASEDTERVRQLRRGMLAGMSIALGMQTVVSLACVFVLPNFLDDHWTVSIGVATLFACTGVMAAVVWLSSAYIITTGRAGSLIYAQVTGVVLSVACGIALNASLILGAAICILRDFVGLIIRLNLIRDSLNVRYILLIAMFLVASVLVGMFSFLVLQGTYRVW